LTSSILADFKTRTSICLNEYECDIQVIGLIGQFIKSIDISNKGPIDDHRYRVDSYPACFAKHYIRCVKRLAILPTNGNEASEMLKTVIVLAGYTRDIGSPTIKM
jgi:hypothetical protein